MSAARAPWKESTKVAVIVPAYNEQALIGATLRGIPSWVAHILVVDDASTDETREVVWEIRDRRVELLAQPENRGVGRAILTGYARALELGADVLVVMAGDNQMDPADLPEVARPVLEDRADYVKGNRFVHPRVGDMPWTRRLAGRMLAIVTSLVAGVRVGDSQCGYAAASARAARSLLRANIWPRYGYPNDVLAVLGRAGYRIVETAVRPVYAQEASGVRFWHVGTILWILLRRVLRNSLELTLERQSRDIPPPVSLGKRAEHPAADASLPR